MKMFGLIAMCLFSTLGVLAQKTDVVVSCTTEVTKLNEKYNSLIPEYKKAKDELDSLKKVLNKSITDDLLNKIKLKHKLKMEYNDSLADVLTNVKQYKAVCRFSDGQLEELFKHPLDGFVKGGEKKESTEKQTYIYFNKNEVIKEDIISNKTIEGRILNDIISQTNQESYLGDIVIPRDGEEFYFYERLSLKEWNEKKKAIRKGDTPNGDGGADQALVISMGDTSNDRFEEDKPNILGEINIINRYKERTDKKYTFKSIDVEIKDGNFFDIRVKVEYKNQIYLFENIISVSFFRFNKFARENFLVYAQKQPYAIENDLSEIENYRIRLSDVLYYEYKIGNNYIPSDLVLELPQDDIEGNKTNLESPAVYQIKEDTYLDKIIELRAYTDAFAVFGDADNGLLQFEGSAKLYLFPYARPFLGTTTQIEYLKSLTPYVNYARFEDDNRFAQVDSGNFVQDLDIIEKRYLTMGVNLNVFELYHKKYPVKTSFFASADYNITEAQNGMADPENIKSLGLGFGVNVATQRFNNFGFSYNMEFKWYDLESFNAIDSFNTDFTIPVFKNEAEVYYHPTDNPNQAIFVRLRTFNYKGDSSSEAFYQFQFGYKFSLGSRSVKKK